jgi:hypothetical protein
MNHENNEKIIKGREEVCQRYSLLFRLKLAVVNNLYASGAEVPGDAGENRAEPAMSYAIGCF